MESGSSRQRKEVASRVAADGFGSALLGSVSSMEQVVAAVAGSREAMAANVSGVPLIFWLNRRSITFNWLRWARADCGSERSIGRSLFERALKLVSEEGRPRGSPRSQLRDALSTRSVLRVSPRLSGRDSILLREMSRVCSDAHADGIGVGKDVSGGSQAVRESVVLLAVSIVPAAGAASSSPLS